MKLLVISGILLANVALVALGFQSQSVTDLPNTGMADPDALMNAFDRYLSNARNGSILTIPLTALRGLTSESLNAGGNVTIDFNNGSVVSAVRGLPTGSFDLWLIDNRPGLNQTTFAEGDDDTLVDVGTYDSRGQLSVTLGRDRLSSFFADRAFVVRKDQNPLNAFVLTGSSTMFDRLARRQVRFVDEAAATVGFDPRAALTRRAQFAKLVAQGRQLFLHEKFGGNGRTCGTCHVETTISLLIPRLSPLCPPTIPFSWRRLIRRSADLRTRSSCGA